MGTMFRGRPASPSYGAYPSTAMASPNIQSNGNAGAGQYTSVPSALARPNTPVPGQYTSVPTPNMMGNPVPSGQPQVTPSPFPQQNLITSSPFQLTPGKSVPLPQLNWTNQQNPQSPVTVKWPGNDATSIAMALRNYSPF